MNKLGILLLIAAAAHGVPVNQSARVTILGRVYEVVLIKTIPKDPPLSMEFRPPRSTILFFKRQAFDIGPNFSKMIRYSNAIPNTKKIISNNFGNTLEIIQGNPVFRVRDTGKSWPVFVGEFNHRLKLCGEDDTSAAFVIGSTKGGAMSKVFAINTMEPHITEGRVIPEEHTDLGDHVSAMLVMSSGRILMSRAVHGVKKSFELIELRPVDSITKQKVQISGRNSDGLTGEELSTDEDEKRSIFEEKTMEMERDIMELHESDAKKMVDFLVEDNKRARLTLQHFQGFSDISAHDHVSEYTYCSQNIQSSIATLGQSFVSLFESNVLLEGLKQKSIENRCEKASKKLEAKIAQILEVGGYRSRKARSPREDGFRLVSVNEALYNQAVGTENFTCFAGEDFHRLQNQMDDIMNILQGNVD